MGSRFKITIDSITVFFKIQLFLNPYLILARKCEFILIKKKKDCEKAVSVILIFTQFFIIMKKINGKD